jgi:methyltransferase
MSRASGSGVAWLTAFLACIALQRLAELALSARNARRLAARGAWRPKSDGFRLITSIHVLFPFALATEVLAARTRPGPGWPWWLGLWLLAQGLRWAAIRALGERWNVRVLVLPGAPRIRHGPYRRLRHPNYLAVVLEFVAAPMMFGAWRTAVVFSVLNALALRRRIRLEEEALASTGADFGRRGPR